MADPEVLKLAEVTRKLDGLDTVHLVALWSDGEMTDCERIVSEANPEGEIDCETQSYSDSPDPARVFYGRLQIDVGLGYKVKVLHDPEAIKFIPDIEKFEKIK